MNDSEEHTVTLRHVSHLKLMEGSNLELGGEAEITRYDLTYYLAPNTDPYGNLTPEISRLVKDDRLRGALIASLRQQLTARWTVTPGVRYDEAELDDSHVSPRLSSSYLLTDKTSVNAAWGMYYQRLPELLLSQNYFEGLTDEPRAEHYVLGISHLLSEATRLTIEVYDKEYSNLPLDPDQPELSIIDESNDQDGFTAHDRLVSTGKARTYGVEVMMQKKLATKLYGILSGSYFRARYEDYHGEWRDRIYDNQVMFTIEGGYKPNRAWEYSLRWVFAGGAPYTPFDVAASTSVNEGIIDDARVNDARLPNYHSLNVRVDRRFHYRNSSLILYLSLWNVYGRENIATYYWNQIDNERGDLKQWGTLPVFGLEFEF
jgi:outer membrane receptor for Fe3+-dicitrate